MAAEQALNNEQAQISVLRYPECVRLRKEMYLTDPDHCIYEIVDNSVDEHAAGRCNAIAIAIVGDEVIVEDDGNGIPITPSPDPEYAHLSQAEVAYTVLHAGGKFGKAGGYKTNTGGLHGVGASCVNAVSENVSLIISTDGSQYQVDFAKGHIINGLHRIGDVEDGKSGTEVHFTLDKEVWGDEGFDFDKIEKRIRQLAYLNPGLTLLLYFDTVDKDGKEVKLEKTYCYPEGIKEYIGKLAKGKVVISDTAYFVKKVVDEKVGEIEVSVAFTYIDGYTTNVSCFVNNIATEAGGDHLTGFKMGSYKAVERYALESGAIKDAKDLESDDAREGMIAVISVKVKEPKFEGQGKSKIKMIEVRNAVKQTMEDFMFDYFNQDTTRAKAIMDKVLKASKARLAAKRAREAARGQKEGMEGGLPGKLADCSEKDPALCEIYLVEGDSAAGSCKSARDRKTQAILPVFGKILNAEKSRYDQVVTNPKLLDMLKALKCGIGNDFDLAKIRYHRIILMSDADVDGSHIQCLNLVFFYRYLRPVIEAGYLYIACPPLYKVSKKVGKKEEVVYLYSKEELDAYDTTNCSVQRYKGLGEMNPDQLWDTTMNPETRKLVRVTISDYELAEEYLSLCMGKDVETRKAFIMDNSDLVA
jgi:DNA gyrase subunit B